jgi:hypothetical protein
VPERLQRFLGYTATMEAHLTGRMILANVRCRPARTIVTVLAVAIEVAMVLWSSASPLASSRREAAN